MNEQELIQKLTAPFEAQDVEWRIQQTTQDKSRGLAVAFITSRAIQKRLDETVGPFHWKTTFAPWHQIGNGSQLCALSIYDEERKEWVTKTDGAENSDIEPVKGGLSDSFKRAAVQWGIGRYLYSLGAVWVDVEQKGKTVTSPRQDASPWTPGTPRCSRGKPQHRKRRRPKEQLRPDRRQHLPPSNRPSPAPSPSITPFKTGSSPRTENSPPSASATGRGGRSSACGPETTGSWPRASACGMCG